MNLYNKTTIGKPLRLNLNIRATMSIVERKLHTMRDRRLANSSDVSEKIKLSDRIE